MAEYLCSKICPLAVARSKRIEDGKSYVDFDPSSPWEVRTAAIEIVEKGVSYKVVALENKHFPGVLRVEVPRDSVPSCNLPERVKKGVAVGGINGAVEQCAYVPEGRAWVTLSREE